MKGDLTSPSQWPAGFHAAASLTFDGAYRDTARDVTPALQARSLKATWFVVSQSIGATLEGRQVADRSTLSSLADHGMEIGSHSQTHPRFPTPWYHPLRQSRIVALVRRRAWRELASRAATILRHPSPANAARIAPPPPCSPPLSHDALHQEISGSRQTLTRALPGIEVTSFAYPHGRFSPTIIRALKDAGYESARTTLEGWNGPGADPFTLRSMLWMRDTSPSAIEEWIDRTVRRHQWIIETFHVVENRPDPSYPWAIDLATFQRHVDALIAHRIWIATQQEIVSYVRWRDSIRTRTSAPSPDALRVEIAWPPGRSRWSLWFHTRIPTHWLAARITVDGPGRLIASLPPDGCPPIARFRADPDVRAVILTREDQPPTHAPTRL